MLVAAIRPAQATVAVRDLNGRLLARAQLPVTSDPVKTTNGILEAWLRMKERHSERSFEGVGISLPGRVDPRTHRLIFAPNLHWPAFDIRKVFEEGTGMSVELDNAANACLLAETWFGRMDGVRNAVLVTVSEGIGTGVLPNRHLVYATNSLPRKFSPIPPHPHTPLSAP